MRWSVSKCKRQKIPEPGFLKQTHSLFQYKPQNQTGNRMSRKIKQTIGLEPIIGKRKRYIFIGSDGHFGVAEPVKTSDWSFKSQNYKSLEQCKSAFCDFSFTRGIQSETSVDAAETSEPCKSGQIDDALRTTIPHRERVQQTAYETVCPACLYLHQLVGDSSEPTAIELQMFDSYSLIKPDGRLDWETAKSEVDRAERLLAEAKRTKSADGFNEADN